MALSFEGLDDLKAVQASKDEVGFPGRRDRKRG